MSKAFRGFLLFFVVVLGLYGVWVQFPRVREPERLQALLSETQTSWDGVQTRAADPAQNGFLTPKFLPWWGRMDKEQVPDSDISKTISHWNQFTTMGVGELKDHLALAKDPEYQKALAGFEAVAPELDQAMRKPLFAVNETPKLELYTAIPNYIAIRASAQAAVGLAEVRVSQGKAQEAAHLVASVARLGHALQGQSSLVQEMIGTAIQMIATDGYVGLLGPDSKLTWAQWNTLAEDLLASVPPTDQVKDAMQGDLYSMINTLERLRVEGKSPDADFQLNVLPGFLAREQRIYSNLMVEILGTLDSDHKVETLAVLTHPTKMDYVTGRMGLVAEVAIPEYARSCSAAEENRSRLVGLSLVSATRAYLAKEKKLPANLEQLKAAGLACPTPEQMAAEHVGFQSSAGEVTITSTYTPRGTDGRRSYWSHGPWADESKPGELVYRVKAS